MRLDRETSEWLEALSPLEPQPLPPQQACGRKLMEPGPTIDSLIEYLLSSFYERDAALSTGTTEVNEKR